MAHRHHNDAVREDSHHDRWHPIQKIGCIADDKSRRRAAEFRKVHAPEKPDWNSNQTRQDEEFRATQDRICEAAARFTHWSGQFRKEIQVECMPALPQQISENKEEHGYRQDRPRAVEGEHDDIRDLPARPASDKVTPLFRVVVKINNRATAFTAIVMQKSTKPNSMSADICMSPVASVNSFAIAATMEQPGANKDKLIFGSFPTTIVTAIVSPSARANARKMDPM